MSIQTESTGTLERAAALQQGTRRFSSFYERHAYLVYNLSLRITCDREIAIESACATFLLGVGAPDPDEGIVKTAVSQALAVAPNRPPAPSGAGDAEAEAMLVATSALTPPERAALALTDIVGFSAAKIGAALDIGERAAEAVLVRAFSGLATRLGKSGEETEAAYRSWLLVEPPAELWQKLYADFYRGLERSLRESQNGNGNGNGVAPVEVERTSRRARRHARRAARRAAKAERPRRRHPLRWAVAILVLGAAGAFAAERAGVIPSWSGSGGGTTAPPAAQSTFGGHISPSKLDQLRLRELRRSRDYAATHPPAPPKRKPAKPKHHKPAKPHKPAHHHKKARHHHPHAQTPPPVPTQQTSPPHKPPKNPDQQGSNGGGQSPNGANSNNGPDPQKCILDQDTGTYICPQQ